MNQTTTTETTYRAVLRDDFGGATYLAKRETRREAGRDIDRVEARTGSQRLPGTWTIQMVVTSTLTRDLI